MRNVEIDLIRDSGLHDYEILNINVNYSDASINLQFKDHSGVLRCLKINDFTMFRISHNEEWGKGKYVASSDLELNDINKTLDLEIQFNSGDIIFIQYVQN